jgi:hypothetical protein
MKSAQGRSDRQTNSASKFCHNFMDYNLLQHCFNVS